MGHSLQAVGLLVQAAQSVFAVPLAARIHAGLVWSNRDQRTLLDKMLALLGILAIEEPFYFVADAYYAAHKMVNGLLQEGKSPGDPGQVQCRRLRASQSCEEQEEKGAPRFLRQEDQAQDFVPKQEVYAKDVQPRLW